MAGETAATAEGEATTETGTAATAATTGAGDQGKAGAAAELSAASASVTADWRVGLQGEEAELAKRFASPSDAVKFIAEQRKEMSTRIRIPDKNAKPEDIAKFNKALGAGENADAYQASFPKPEGRDFNDTEKAVQTKVAEVLHKHHVPVAATGELHGVLLEAAKGIEAEKDRVALKGREDNEAALRKEWGADYDQNIQLGSRAAKQFGGDALLDFAAKSIVDGIKLGDHPAFLRAWGQVGRRMGEGQFIGAVGQAEQVSAQETITAKTREKNNAWQKGDRALAQRLDKELMELQGRLHGHAPVVGQGGRQA